VENSSSLPGGFRPRARRRFGAWASAVAVACAFVASPLPAAAQLTAGRASAATEIVHVKISGPLDVGTQSLMRRGIERAKAGPHALIVELDTPGGEMELMFKLATQLADANKDGVLTIAWIHDHAYSAGALVALSCERIYSSAQGAIGAAAVVEVRDGQVHSIEDDPGKAAKVNAAVRSAFRAFAESHHRPAALAEGMVDRMVGVKQVRTKDGELRVVTQSEFEDGTARAGEMQLVHTIAERGNLVALSGSQAVMFGLADGVADSLQDLLGMVGFAGANIVSVERARSEDLATWLSSVYYVLIGLGLMALIAEFKSPGFGLAGAIAIACFALALFGEYLVGLADVPHLVAVGLGLVLVAVELFLMPGAVWPGAIGAALVFGGLAFAQMGPGFLTSPFGRELALDNALEFLLGLLVAVCAAGVLSRWLPKTPLVGRLVLTGPSLPVPGGAPARELVRAPQLGERGLALTPLRPVGKVRLADQADEVEARASGVAIDAGARVKVVAVEGLRAVVEQEAERGA